MEKIKVEYKAGQSRYGDQAVDYMLADVDGIELYAELENDTWNEEIEAYEDESATYEDLKEEIIEQAKENEIDISRLAFWYDE